jgi:hypothetical protein
MITRPNGLMEHGQNKHPRVALSPSRGRSGIAPNEHQRDGKCVDAYGAQCSSYAHQASGLG